MDNDKDLGNNISNDTHYRNIVSSVCDLYQRSNSTISDFNACNSDTTHYRNIVSSVCDLYQRSNSTISDFNACNSDTLDRLHSSFCMHMYGCEL